MIVYQDQLYTKPDQFSREAHLNLQIRHQNLPSGWL